MRKHLDANFVLIRVKAFCLESVFIRVYPWFRRLVAASAARDSAVIVEAGKIWSISVNSWHIRLPMYYLNKR